MTGAIRRYMAENPSRFDPRDYLKPAMAAAKGVCKERYQQFGCAGWRRRSSPCRPSASPRNTSRASSSKSSI